MAIASLILGIFALLTWLLPCLGFPVALTGLILGIIAKKKGAKGQATAGIIMSSIGLVATVINSALGVLIAISNTM